MLKMLRGVDPMLSKQEDKQRRVDDIHQDAIAWLVILKHLELLSPLGSLAIAWHMPEASLKLCHEKPAPHYGNINRRDKSGG